MKRIGTTLKDKWPEYILEIIVLIIGIYGAFALNTWNESRKEREIERYYLVNLHKDFELQLAEIEENRIYEDHLKQSLKRAVEIMESDFENIDLHQFNLDLSSIWLARLPKFYDATFRDLNSTGNLNLISNRSLKESLNTHYQRFDRIAIVIEDNVRENNRYLVEDVLRHGLLNLKFDLSFMDGDRADDYGDAFSKKYAAKFDKIALNQLKSDVNLLLLHNAINGRNIILNTTKWQMNDLKKSTLGMIRLLENELNHQNR